MGEACFDNTADAALVEDCQVSAAPVLGPRCHWRRRPLIFVAEINPPLCKIIRGHFYRDPVTGQYADAIFLHSAGRIRERLVPVVELYTKTRIGKELLYRTFKLDQVFLGQRDLLDEGTGAPGVQLAGAPPRD